jgi:hypothetical protein
MELARLKIDEHASTEGKWFYLGDGAEIKMVSTTSPNVRAYHRKNERDFAKYRNFKSDVPEDKALDYMTKLYAFAVIKDWKGVTLKGENVPFSSEKVYEILKEYPAFFNKVVEAANDESAFFEDYVEDSVKN